MYTYRLHLEDGSDAGEVTYAVMVKPGEEILVGNGRRFRVLDVVPIEEESRFSGCYGLRPRSAGGRSSAAAWPEAAQRWRRRSVAVAK